MCFQSQARDLIAAQFVIGDDPENNPTESLNSLRTTYESIQRTLRTLLFAYMDQGLTNVLLAATPDETVAFLRSGELLNLPNKADDDMIEDASREIIKSTVCLSFQVIWTKGN
jgi:hypothetical protein